MTQLNLAMGSEGRYTLHPGGVGLVTDGKVEPSATVLPFENVLFGLIKLAMMLLSEATVQLRE